MKQFCILALVLLNCASLSALKEKVQGGGDSVEKTILQLEDASRDAALKADPSWSEKNLADDFVRITPTGAMLNKQQFIDTYKTTKFESIDFTDRKVRIYGDSVVVNATVNVKGTSGGTDISSTNRSTRVWAKIKGQWKLVNFQTTRVQQ